MIVPDTSKTKRPALLLIRATFSLKFGIGRRFVLRLGHIKVKCLRLGGRATSLRQGGDAYNAHQIPLRKSQNVPNGDVLRRL
mgnify:CR=1 FL=1